jgi:uncharacterized membrane protein (UPF0127 family)
MVIMVSPVRFERRSFKQVALAAALVAALSPIVAQPRAAHAQAAPAVAESTLETLEIATATGKHRFSVEVMRTDEQRARGLMHRRFMPAERGMLFDFKREDHVAMWMKNTFIPLDMLFIDRTGKIVSIAENTEPLSERTIPSGGPVLAVLEVNAGVARKIGAKPGDQLTHPLFR